MKTEEIFENLKNVLVKNFEIDESDVTMDASFGEDLDLDSIDVVDLIVALNTFAPDGSSKLDASLFKTARKVSDAVTIIENAWK